MGAKTTLVHLLKLKLIKAGRIIAMHDHQGGYCGAKLLSDLLLVLMLISFFYTMATTTYYLCMLNKFINKIGWDENDRVCIYTSIVNDYLKLVCAKLSFQVKYIFDKNT